MKQKWFVGYLASDLGLLYPDVFCDSGAGIEVGKPWGSYVSVAGPWETEDNANRAVRLTHDVWPFKRDVSAAKGPIRI
jgi:hypothetical protein